MTTSHEYKVGDTVWFRSPRMSNRYEATVVGILKWEGKKPRTLVNLDVPVFGVWEMWVPELCIHPKTERVQNAQTAT